MQITAIANYSYCKLLNGLKTLRTFEGLCHHHGHCRLLLLLLQTAACALHKTCTKRCKRYPRTFSKVSATIMATAAAAALCCCCKVWQSNLGNHQIADEHVAGDTCMITQATAACNPKT
jgi:hypothetical protein